MKVFSFVLLIASWSLLDAYGGLLQQKDKKKQLSKKIVPTRQFDLNFRQMIQGKSKASPVTEAPNKLVEEDKPPAHLAEALAFLDRQAKRKHKDQSANQNTVARSSQTNVAGSEVSNSNNILNNAITSRHTRSQTSPLETVQQRPLPNQLSVEIQQAIHNKERVASQPAMQGQQALHQMRLQQDQSSLQTIPNNHLQTNQHDFVNQALQMAAKRAPQSVHQQIHAQALPQSVPRHVLFPRAKPQPAPQQRNSAGPRYVVVRSPETGALQLKQIGSPSRNSVVNRQTVPPQKQFTYPTVFPEPYPTTFAPNAYNHRPPRPPIYLTQAPTTTTTTTPLTTTRTPSPVKITTNRPSPTWPPTPPPSQQLVKNAAPIDPAPENVQNTWEQPKKDIEQVFLEKEIKKQSLEITKLQLEIKLLRRQTSNPDMQQQELEEMPPMFQRMHKKRMGFGKNPFQFMQKK